jgi:hypothetical protein
MGSKCPANQGSSFTFNRVGEGRSENMVMLNTPRYVVTLFAFAVLFLLAAPTLSFADSGQGTQKGPTKKGDKNTPKKPETHSHGTVTTKTPTAGHLKGPELHESGKGKLEGGEKKGDKNTPKRAPTHGLTPS